MTRSTELECTYFRATIIDGFTELGRGYSLWEASNSRRHHRRQRVPCNRPHHRMQPKIRRPWQKAKQCFAAFVVDAMAGPDVEERAPI